MIAALCPYLQDCDAKLTDLRECSASSTGTVENGLNYWPQRNETQRAAVAADIHLEVNMCPHMTYRHTSLMHVCLISDLHLHVILKSWVSCASRISIKRNSPYIETIVHSGPRRKLYGTVLGRASPAEDSLPSHTGGPLPGEGHSQTYMRSSGRGGLQVRSGWGGGGGEEVASRRIKLRKG